MQFKLYWYEITMTLLWLSFLLFGYSQASASPSSLSSRIPPFIDVDEPMEDCFEMAKESHRKAIQSAMNSYYSSSADSLPSSEEISDIIMKSHILQLPSNNWRLPDLNSELKPEIKVTHGADSDVDSTPLFTPDECQNVIDAAEAHFEGREWTTLPSGSFDVAGSWIKDIPAVHDWFNRMVRHRLFPLLAREFPEFCSADDLVVDNSYIFKYTPETGRRTGIHTDSGCLSFTIALGGDYEGGGTWMDGYDGNNDGTVTMRQGHVTIRPGGIRHCGQAVTKGTRYIIGGFCMHRKKVEHCRMLINLGNELLSKGQAKKARKVLEAAIRINPNFDGSYSHLAEAYEELKLDPIPVLEHCYHHVNPRNGEIAYTLGMKYAKQQKIKDAIECFMLCLELDPHDVESMMSLAQIVPEKEEYWCERILATPGAAPLIVASACSQLGALYGNKNEIAKEIEYYQKGLQVLGPKNDNHALRYSLACAYASSQEYPKAIEAFQRALQLIDSNHKNHVQTLQNLYRVAFKQIQQLHPQGFTSQDEMILALRQLMGDNNYQQLAAGNQKS